MSEDTNNTQDSHGSGDSSILTEKTDSSTLLDIPQSTIIESISGGVSDTSTQTGTLPDDVERVENSSSAETGLSITRIKDNPSSDEPSQSIEVPTLELPKNSSSSTFPPKQPNTEIIPIGDIKDSLSTNIRKRSGILKVKNVSAAKKVRFCLPASHVLNTSNSESTDISSSTSTQSFQNIDTTTISGRFPKDTILNMPDFLEGLASRLLPEFNTQQHKTCGTKAKKRSFAESSADSKEPSPESSPSAKRSDFGIPCCTSKFQEGLLSGNPKLLSMLDANPRPSVSEQSAANLIPQFNMFASEDGNCSNSYADQETPVGAAVETSSAAELPPPAAFTEVPSVSGPPSVVAFTEVSSASEPPYVAAFTAVSTVSESPSAADFTEIPSAAGPSSTATFTEVPSAAGPSSAATFTEVPSAAGPSSAAAFTEVPSAAGPSSAAAFTEVPNVTGPSTSRSSQNSPLRKCMGIHRYIANTSQMLLQQVRELGSLREFWLNQFPSVALCLEQEEKEPVVDSQRVSSLREETEELVDRLKNLIIGLIEISDEMIAFFRSETNWKTLKFEERLTDYLQAFNATNDTLENIQIEIERLKSDCINYEPCLFSVNAMENSSIGIKQRIARITSHITRILARINREH